MMVLITPYHAVLTHGVFHLPSFWRYSGSTRSKDISEFSTGGL